MASNDTSTKSWDAALACEAIERMHGSERALVWRLADARGQRVPMTELAATFGLPAAVARDQDFPALTAFCSEGGPKVPIEEGAGEDGWYWMSPENANAFRRGFKKAAEQ